MPKSKAFILFILIFCLLKPALGPAQNSSLRGKVMWASGDPAIGLEIQLRQDGRVLATTFTNEKGLYAFFHVSPPPPELDILVSDRNRVLKEQRITGIGRNEAIPDITIE